MKYFKQLMIIIVISYISYIINSLLPFTFPSAIISIIILLFLLLFNVVKLESIEAIGNFLLQNMSFVFIPAGIQLISYIDIIKDIWLRFSILCILSTLLVFISVAGTTSLIIKLKEKRK